jgi:site-specific DNA-methyltransferase (adenine-specific)
MLNGMHWGRWEDLLPKVTEGSVDLVLTDPPYGLGYVSNIPGDKTWNKSGKTISRFDKPIEGDTPEANEAIAWDYFFSECFRVLKDDSYCVLHCNPPFLGQRWENIKRSGFTYKGTIAWNKRFAIGGDLKGAAKRDWEPIIYLAKGKPSLNPIDVKRKGELVERKRISEIEDWVFTLGSKEKCGHPTQKPLELTERFILWMTQEGATVLDPFAGSGTTLLAAQRSNRVGLGFEMDEGFFEIAEKRLKAEGEQG